MDDIRYFEEEFINNEDEESTLEDEEATKLELYGLQKDEETPPQNNN